MTDDKPISEAKLDWSSPDDQQGAPRSVFFDDIYFSGDGAAETTHVFLNGNDLPKRFQTAQQFTIGELGFGTGLNFLVAWEAWRRAKKTAGARLHFLSVEAFPLSPDDLEKSHRHSPQLAELSKKLIANHPPPQRGFHQLTFDDDAALTLYLGDAQEGLARAEAGVDAWFLDGFAPDRNPAMWSPEIMRELARLSKPGATFATFTVAGAVRRALQGAGFTIEKRPGFGRKREMLAGRLEDAPEETPRRQPWFNTRPAEPLNKGARIAIIGAGVAGASLAHALRNAGFAPSVYEANAPASGASGNPAGLIMPRLDADETPAARFFAHAYLYTIRLLNNLQENATDALFNPCGVRVMATSDKDGARFDKLMAMPALPGGWIERAGNGLHFPHAGVANPPAFVRALLGETPLRETKVTRLEKIDDEWRITDAAGDTGLFDAVIIANGLDALRFGQVRSLPLAGSAGQIDWFPDVDAPPHAAAFGPYAAPAPDGGLVIGATYAPVAIGALPEFSREATQSNVDAVRRTLPDLADGLTADASHPRASIRCTTPDRLPIAGPVPDWGFYAGAYDGLRQGKRRDYPDGQCQDGLYVLTGLGSRGLVTAPLAAAMIAAEIAGAPAPADSGVAEALHPARFFIRDLKKAKTG